MTTLRELVARYDLKFNDRAFKKADTAMNKLVTAAKGLGVALSAAALGRGFMNVVRLASDANETMNVLNESFGDNVTAVKEWAATMSKEIGRSEYAMREMAGSVGAVLNPLMQKNSDIASEMSMTMAQLAVDLGSFYNTTDKQAMDAMVSGLTGMSLPLRKFGVVLLDEVVANFAKAEGFTKKWSKFTIDEKTWWRYKYILDQTTQAQGDAKRTSEGFANASKAAGDALRDVATRIGLTVLPAVEWFLLKFRRVAQAMSRVVEETNIVQAALVTLGTVGLAAGIKMLVPYAGALLIFAKWAVIIGAIILVVDELITTFKGRDTVLRDFIDSLFGVGATEEMVKALTKAWNDLKEGIKYAWDVYQVYLDNAVALLDKFTKAFDKTWEKAKNIFNSAITWISDTWTKLVNWMSDRIPEPIKKLFGMAGKGIKIAADFVVDKTGISDAIESGRKQWEKLNKQVQEKREKRRRRDIERRFEERAQKTAKERGIDIDVARRREKKKMESQALEISKKTGMEKHKAWQLVQEGKTLKDVSNVVPLQGRERSDLRERVIERRHTKEIQKLEKEKTNVILLRPRERQRPQRQAVRTPRQKPQTVKADVHARVKADVQPKVVHIRTPQTAAAASAPVINQENKFNMSVSTKGKPDIREFLKTGKQLSKEAAKHQERATVEALKQRVGT